MPAAQRLLDGGARGSGSPGTTLARFLLDGPVMRTKLVVLAALAALAAGCAESRPSHPRFPVQYTCSDVAIVHDGNTLQVTGRAVAPVSWRDDAGSHFLLRPATGVDVIEYVVPDDPYRDASARVFDASTGTSTVDWRLVKRDVCVARGGYSDALVHYARGESVAEVATALTAGDREEALGLVHHALRELQGRYYKER